ncbi:MAG TPA: polysaccharide biosynthesis/export family protein, partial [Gemmatimonadaceae bacterium]|nr:polysaccharide biosynthesis/export family protein [Gemmatimonadaceae bacterium]
MIRFRLGSLLAAAFLCAGARPVFAQRPTPAQAQELLRTRPDLVAQLRQRLTSSGLTPDQVRARLRAEGYPEDMLDPYLADARGDTVTAPSDSALLAARALGITDSTDVALAPSMSRVAPVSAPVDTAALRARPGFSDTSAIVLPPRDSGYTIFGLNVFQGGTSQFDPNGAGPVDANYRLGPGDQLVLILTGDVELAHTLDVTREGFVVIPQVGQLYVANLTLGQLEDVLYSRLGRV